MSVHACVEAEVHNEQSKAHGSVFMRLRLQTINDYRAIYGI